MMYKDVKEVPIEHVLISQREKVLEGAKKCVLQDRNNTYGPPEDSFERVAALWNADIGNGSSLTSVDASNMLILLKLARNRENPLHFDNYVDIAGYAACGAECAFKEVKVNS